MGLDPGPFTLRELAWMAEGRSREVWNHTSAVLAILANAHRDPKKSRVFKPGDFHPYAKRALFHDRPPLKAPITLLRTIFVKPNA